MKIKKIFLTSMAIVTLMSTIPLTSFAANDIHNVKTQNGVIATFVENNGKVSRSNNAFRAMSASNLVWNHNGYTTSCTPLCCNRRNDVVVAETSCTDSKGNGQYHYSRARKEKNGAVVNNIDSGRCFGTGNSKAVSPHFDPYTGGIAKTYYGTL